MRGLLVDINVQGHKTYLLRLWHDLELTAYLEGLACATFAEVNLADNSDDRSIWRFCQREGWILFTENRNQDGVDSLQTTLDDEWQLGCLPIVTLGSKKRFEHDRAYAKEVAAQVADVLYEIKRGNRRDQPRIYVPQ